MTPRALLLLVVLHGGALFILLNGSVGLAVLVEALMLLCVKRYRRTVRRALTVVLVVVAFVGLIAAARMVGGESLGAVQREYLPRLDALIFLTVALASWYGIFRPSQKLAVFDALKVPRWAGYLVVGLETAIEYVRQTGAYQVQVLRLKGLLGKTARLRVHAYRRLVGPMFFRLLSRQVEHARSLSRRGFFSDRLETQSLWTAPTFEESGVVGLSLLILVIAGVVLRWAVS